MMSADRSLVRALNGAVVQLLRPLFRVLLRHNMSFTAFTDLAKRVYVDVATSDFRIPGKKPSISRASILSGLTRKEVTRLLSEPMETSAENDQRYNRAARVLSAWVRDRDFLDSSGAPLALEGQGGPSSFAALVKRYSGDMPVRAVLDELLRVGAVRRRDDMRLEPVTRAYVPQSSVVDKLAILGNDVGDLIATIDHNIEHGAADPFFQRKVMYHSIPATALPAFRKLSSAQGQAQLEELDRWLNAHDTVDPPELPAAPRARVGVGIYYFEERLGSSNSKEQ